MTSSERVEIDDSGRLLVPEPMRRALGLTAATQVEITVRRERN